MIGALSIVRFRHPVRSNFELTMYFALLTLGISAGVNMKLAFLLLVVVFITIIGIEAFQFFAKYFNLKIFQTSFNEGVSNNVLEISSSKKNMKIQENTNLVESYYSKSENLYSFKLVFKNKNEHNSAIKTKSKNPLIVIINKNIFEKLLTPST